MILIDPRQLLRIRIPKYAVSFEAKYKKSRQTLLIMGFSNFRYLYNTSVAKIATWQEKSRDFTVYSVCPSELYLKLWKRENI